MTKNSKRISPAQRLEYVRTQEGFRSVRSFWLALGGSDSGFSYEGVRNYHDDVAKRRAPLGYLEAIRKRFPQYSLAYLAGETDVASEDEAVQQQIATMSEDGASASTIDPTTARRVAAHRSWWEMREAMGAGDGGGIDEIFWKSPAANLPYWAAPLADIRRRIWGRHYIDATKPGGHDDKYQAEQRIGEALKGPLLAMGVDPTSLEHDQLGTYIINMLPTLNWLVDAPDVINMMIAERRSIVFNRHNAAHDGDTPAATTPKRTRSANQKTPTKKRTRSK